MKKFFIMIWKWFISLFKKRVKEIIPAEKAKTESVPETPYQKKEFRKNNRKCTRGRHTQYINMGNHTRPIFHNT